MMDNNLKESFKRFVTMRKTCTDFLDKIEKEKLFVIPDNFGNNIYWQAGHILASAASLLYLRTNQKLPIDEKYFKYFAKGTSPKDFDENIFEFDKIYNDLNNQVEVIEDDLADLQILEYDQSITVSTGHEIKTFTDALSFLSLHEAYHYSSMRTLSKFV